MVYYLLSNFGLKFNQFSFVQRTKQNYNCANFRRFKKRGRSCVVCARWQQYDTRNLNKNLQVVIIFLGTCNITPKKSNTEAIFAYASHF